MSTSSFRRFKAQLLGLLWLTTLGGWNSAEVHADAKPGDFYMGIESRAGEQSLKTLIDEKTGIFYAACVSKGHLKERKLDEDKYVLVINRNSSKAYIFEIVKHSSENHLLITNYGLFDFKQAKLAPINAGSGGIDKFWVFANDLLNANFSLTFNLDGLFEESTSRACPNY